MNNGYSIACSADGYKLVVALLAGPIYTWSEPSPSLPAISISNAKINPAANVLLTWPSSATNFALQHSLDLTASNWLMVTNKPTLVQDGQSSTQKMYQVMLPATNSRDFYRLKAP